MIEGRSCLLVRLLRGTGRPKARSLRQALVSFILTFQLGPAPHWARGGCVPPRTYPRLFGVHEVRAQLLGCLADRDRCRENRPKGVIGLDRTALARKATGRLAATGRACASACRSFSGWQ